MRCNACAFAGLLTVLLVASNTLTLGHGIVSSPLFSSFTIAVTCQAVILARNVMECSRGRINAYPFYCVINSLESRMSTTNMSQE